MTPCKECGGLIAWIKIEGRWHCHNANGSDHWDTCSKRKWQQVKDTGVKFEDQRTRDGIVSGFADSIHGTKLSRHSRPHKGPSKLSGDCKACVPPWQVCQACPDGITP